MRRGSVLMTLSLGVAILGQPSLRAQDLPPGGQPVIARDLTGNFEVSMQDTVPGLRYSLQFSEDLQTWTDVPRTAFYGDNGPHTVMSSPGDPPLPRAFYRWQMTLILGSASAFTVQQLTSMNKIANLPPATTGGGGSSGGSSSGGGSSGGSSGGGSSGGGGSGGGGSGGSGGGSPEDGVAPGANLVDTDGDGFSDFVETVFGTDPEDGNDHPAFPAVELSSVSALDFTSYHKGGTNPDGTIPWFQMDNWLVGDSIGDESQTFSQRPTLRELRSMPSSENADWSDYNDLWSLEGLPSGIIRQDVCGRYYQGGADSETAEWWLSWLRLRMASMAPMLHPTSQTYLMLRLDEPSDQSAPATLAGAEMFSLTLPAGRTSGEAYVIAEPPHPGTTSTRYLTESPFYTKGDWGVPARVDFCYNGTATPVVEAQVSSCTINGSGVVTLALSGDITDATSDLIDDPVKQLASVDVTAPGLNPVTLNLSNETDPEAEPDIWRPYAWQSSFSTTVSFAAAGEGDYPVSITTALNAAGMAAATEAVVHVSTSQLHVALSAGLDPMVADQLTIYTSSTPSGDPSETYTETGADTKTFTLNGQTATFQIEVLNPQPLTSNVDTLNVRLTRNPGTAQEQHTDYSLTETGAETNNFSSGTLYSASVSQPPVNHPGNFMPIVICFPAIDALRDTDLTVNIMGRDWTLKEMSLGSLYGMVVVDDQDNPVVFNPSAFAHTHIQTKPIDMTWYTEFKAKGNSIGYLALKTLTGLISHKPIPDSYLGDSLVLNDLERGVKKFGSEAVYYVSPKRFNDQLQSVGHKQISNSVKPEILWRYVTAEKVVIPFEDVNQLARDVTYRQKVVDYAKTAKFAYIGEGSERKDPKFVKTLWSFSTGDVLGQKVYAETLDGVPASVALSHVFDPNTANSFDYSQSVYAFACEASAQLVVQRAVLDIIGAPIYDTEVKLLPLKWGSQLFIQTRGMPDKAFWIPGDWGYLLTVDKKRIRSDGTQGENVIYIGGSYKKNYPEFATSGFFWGPGMQESTNNIMTLQDMITKLENAWGAQMVPSDVRFDLKPKP